MNINQDLSFLDPPRIKNVLIIDDEEAPRKVLSRILEGRGLNVSSIDSPALLDQAFSRMDYQLVTLDIRMPGYDGLDVIDTLQKRYPTTMIIMVTAVFEMDVAIDSMKRGAVDYVLKPFNVDSVMIAVDRANQLYGLRMENQLYRKSLEDLVLQRTQQVINIAEELKIKNKEIEAMNQDLISANQKLESYFNKAIVADKVSTVGMLSSMLIHGIANPLAVIQGLIDVVHKKNPKSETLDKDVKMMKDSIDQIISLVNEVRSYVKTEQHRFELINLNEIIEMSVSLITNLAKRKNITVVSNLSVAVTWINGNSSQLHQLFVNLIHNAVQAIPESGKIEISDQRNDQSVTIIIQDNGSGFDPDHLNKIFKMFFTTKPAGEGTGLGLFICKEIMEKHNGSITIESEKNRGTKVMLKFALVEQPKG